jgi:hypothetical protein
MQIGLGRKMALQMLSQAYTRYLFEDMQTTVFLRLKSPNIAWEVLVDQ